MKLLFHYNPGLQHQVDHAHAFADCGFDITPTPDGDADVHVVSGPYFALRQWRAHPHVLVIDRAWWGDPDCISIGWLQPDGTRKFAMCGTEPRPQPSVMPWKTRECSAIILADYKQDIDEIDRLASQRFVHVRIRRHPAEEQPIHKLHDMLTLSDVCIGHSGSAIFEAIVLGVPTICTDPQNVCAPVCAGNILDDELWRGNRAAWLHAMSYRQFNLNEIDTAWELLKDAL